jgi:hypothetical protein
MGFAPQDGYIVDTSAFIHMGQSYPQDVFPTLWNRLEELIGRDGRVRSPEQVQEELNVGADALARWADSKRSTLFVPEDGGLLEKATGILRDFPRLVDPESSIPEADPFVIALAEQYGWTVVTMERKSKVNETKQRIPDVCVGRKIGCCDLLGLFRREGWKV